MYFFCYCSVLCIWHALPINSSLVDWTKLLINFADNGSGHLTLECKSNQTYAKEISSEEEVFYVPSLKVSELKKRLLVFMEKHIYPMENEFSKFYQSNERWTIHPKEEELKELARREGLWNLWIPVCVFILGIINVLFSSFFSRLSIKMVRIQNCW